MDELLEELEKLNKELRSASDKYLDQNNKVEDVDKEIAELRSKVAEVKKEIAQRSAPKDPGEGKIASPLYDKRSWLDAAKEKRSITIGSTGAINQVKDLVKKVADNNDILQKASFYYGPNASTIIPVLAPIDDPDGYAEGASDVAVDTDAGVSVCEITPKAYAKILPITAEALTMNTIDLEKELPEVFAKAFRKVMHSGMMSGSGSSKAMKGLFVSAASGTKTQLAASQTAIKLSDLSALALTVSSKDEEYEIVMHPQTYSAILADSTSGEDVKIYKESLIRDKMIEGVKIRLDSKAPYATTAGSVLAVAAPLSRYAIGVAGELEISPIKVKGDTKTYFQAIMFFSGKQVSDSDLYCLAVKSA